MELPVALCGIYRALPVALCGAFDSLPVALCGIRACSPVALCGILAKNVVRHSVFALPMNDDHSCVLTSFKKIDHQSVAATSGSPRLGTL
ncbi:hypothetical protein [Deinococcus aquatilis]|uniref:hypothetical protein n=1 Tax=Deinococcus aquatilis TaxID=519440 RepID=UPI0012FAC8DF|nr:hypothetical protein [Deinococcus aquatilis]